MSRFRKQYRQLREVEVQRIAMIKRYAEQLEDIIEQVPEPRYKALALTALEESVMWATKGTS